MPSEFKLSDYFYSLDPPTPPKAPWEVPISKPVATGPPVTPPLQHLDPDALDGPFHPDFAHRHPADDVVLQFSSGTNFHFTLSLLASRSSFFGGLADLPMPPSESIPLLPLPTAKTEGLALVLSMIRPTSSSSSPSRTLEYLLSWPALGCPTRPRQQLLDAFEIADAYDIPAFPAAISEKLIRKLAVEPMLMYAVAVAAGQARLVDEAWEAVWEREIGTVPEEIWRIVDRWGARQDVERLERLVSLRGRYLGSMIWDTEDEPEGLETAGAESPHEAEDDDRHC